MELHLCKPPANDQQHLCQQMTLIVATKNNEYNLVAAISPQLQLKHSHITLASRIPNLALWGASLQARLGKKERETQSTKCFSGAHADHFDLLVRVQTWGEMFLRKAVITLERACLVRGKLSLASGKTMFLKEIHGMISKTVDTHTKWLNAFFSLGDFRCLVASVC